MKNWLHIKLQSKAIKSVNIGFSRETREGGFAKSRLQFYEFMYFYRVVLKIISSYKFVLFLGHGIFFIFLNIFLKIQSIFRIFYSLSKRLVTTTFKILQKYSNSDIFFENSLAKNFYKKRIWAFNWPSIKSKKVWTKSN